MNELETIDIRTGRPFAGLQKTREHGSLDGASIDGSCGRARGLLGGAFMGTMLAKQGGGSLPYDAEVEYITSINSNSYLDTLVTTHKDNDIDVTFATSGSSSKDAFGDWHTSDSFSQRLFYNNTSLIRWDIGLKRITMNFTADRYLSINNPRRFKMGNMYVTDVNYDVTETSTPVNSFDGEGYTFKACHWHGNTIRLYALTISRYGVDLFDSFPVRMTNDAGNIEGAMYDKVSGLIFRSVGTEVFNAGPDK